MDEHFKNKNVSTSLCKFLCKNIQDEITFQIVDNLITHGIKQNVIQQFVLKKLYSHKMNIQIMNHLIQLVKYPNYSNLYLFGCVKMADVDLVFNLLGVFVQYKVNDMKSLLKNFSVKIINKSIDKMKFVPMLLDMKLKKDPTQEFLVITKIVHKCVDILDKSETLDDAVESFNKVFFH
jgi:hypothetical protein